MSHQSDSSLPDILGPYSLSLSSFTSIAKVITALITTFLTPLMISRQIVQKQWVDKTLCRKPVTVDINVNGGLVCRIVFCDSDAHYRNFVVFLPNCPQWRQISNTICNSQVAKQHKQRLKHDQTASKKLSYIVNNLDFNCILKTFGAVDLENFWKNVANGQWLHQTLSFTIYFLALTLCIPYMLSWILFVVIANVNKLSVYGKIYIWSKWPHRKSEWDIQTADKGIQIHVLACTPHTFNEVIQQSVAMGMQQVEWDIHFL